MIRGMQTERDWFLIEEIPRAYTALLAGWAECLSKSFADEFGRNIDVALMHRQGTLYLFFREKQWKTAEKNLFTRAMQKPEFLERIIEWNRSTQKRQFLAAERIRGLNPEKMGDAELIGEYKKFFESFDNAIAAGWPEMVLEFRGQLLSGYL